LLGSHAGRLKREDSPPSSAGTAASRPADAMRKRRVEGPDRAHGARGLSNDGALRQRGENERRGLAQHLICSRSLSSAAPAGSSFFI
jgi:hypothetical protein